LLIGTVRFVSKTGTSTPPYTSWQTAADSIQKCINICVDGDTVYVANGIYTENLVINTQIFLSGLSMDSTVIDGTGLGRYTIDINSITQLENFRVFGKGTVESWAIRSFQPLNINSCNISDCGLAVGLVGVPCIMNKVIITNVTSYGFGGGCFSDTCNYFISNSVIILNAENTIGITTTIGGYYHITNNIILFAGTNSNSGSGISFGAPRKVYVNNNLISGFSSNIFFDTVQDTAFIINNILAYGRRGILGSYYIVKTNNSILSKNEVGIEYDNKLISDYNLFWKNSQDIIGIGTSPTYGDSDRIIDPMFVKDTLPNPQLDFDYHLQAFSPAIDKGDPSILDVDGSRSDIGMFGGPYGQKYTYQDLAPKPPRNLTASMDSGLVHLKWNKNTEADLFRYRVYRDTVPDFIYDTTKIVAVISDTTFYDDPPQKFISGNYYYKITAIDSAYHQSPASEEAHINITGIPEAPPIVVEHYNLLQNYPNPFNPSTTIPYRLKAPGYVKVMVYNLLGEQVKVLVNKYQSAGYYEVLFHPTATERQSAEGKIEFETGYGDIVSGIYLYRIEVIGEGNLPAGRQGIPVFTDMKKMMLVK